MAIKLQLSTVHIMSGEAYDDFINDLCQLIPDCWDNDVSVESIILDFVRQVTQAASPWRAHHKSWCNGVECEHAEKDE
jgi:hypothetical protein